MTDSSQKNKRGFLYNSIVLMAGTAIAQVVPLLLSPLLSRLFSPADFAVYGLYYNAVSMFAVVVTLRYELTIVLPKENSDANRLVWLSIAIAFAVGLIFLIPAIFLNDWMCNQLNNSDFHIWLYLVPVSMTLIGIYQAFNYYLTRQKAFTGSAVNRVTQKLGEGSANLLCGYMKVPGGLVLGDIAGRTGVAVMAAVQASKNGLNFGERRSFSGLGELAKRYRHFALIGTGPALLNAISLTLPIFFISSFFDKGITGQFNFSRMFLAAPLSIISANIAQVLLQRITEQKHAGKTVSNELKRIFLYLLGASVSIALILQILAPWIFRTIFGNQWEAAGEYSSILAFAFAIRFAVSPLSVVFTAFERVKALSGWQLMYALLIAGLYLLKGNDIKHFLWAYTFIDIISYSIYLILIVRTLKKHDNQTDKGL